MEDYGSLVGATFPPFSFTVERGKIREFAAAIGDMKDIYLDPQKAAAAGYRDVVAPPTFGTVIDMWGGTGFMEMCEKLKLNPVRVLHGGQEYQYPGVITAGDEITVNTTITGDTEKKNMRILTMESVYVNQNNEEVLRCVKIVLELK